MSRYLQYTKHKVICDDPLPLNFLSHSHINKIPKPLSRHTYDVIKKYHTTQPVPSHTHLHLMGCKIPSHSTPTSSHTHPIHLFLQTPHLQPHPPGLHPIHPSSQTTLPQHLKPHTTALPPSHTHLHMMEHSVVLAVGEERSKEKGLQVVVR